MVTHSQQLTPDDESQDSNASSSVSKIFSDSESNSNSNSDLELDSEDSDNKDDSPEDFSNNDSQLPPEYYLEQAESLDISQLQQKRYSDGTQEKLDETLQQWKKVSDSDETLAAITASRLKALLYLRYHDIGLTLIRDPDGGRPRLFIFLKPDFTKRFLGKKAAPVLDCPEKLYSLRVLDTLEKRLTESTLRYWMRRVSKITGFEQVTRPYLL
ncbi:hypothetical protein Y699_05958 [Aspergillus fumigatus Z5]|nr:hypothetical protein Y699_05958 [Aspergillus fumigatus Z5]